MPTSMFTNVASSPSTSNLAGTPDAATDPLAGVDHIIVIDNGAHNIRIASIPYPFPASTLTAATTAASSASSSSSQPLLDPKLLARTITIDVFPNAIARTRTPHIIPATTSSPTAPPPGSKTSIFVSSHIHTLLDDYAALHLRLPHQGGIVVDWAAQKTIWDHVLHNHLAKVQGGTSAGKKGKLLANKAVIITEPYLNLEHSQHATDLLLFEHYGAQAVWRTSPAALIGWGTNAFHADPPLPASTQAEAAAAEEERDPKEVDSTSPADEGGSTSSPAKRHPRNPRVSSSSSATGTTDAAAAAAAQIPRLLSPRRPECMLIIDLGYSFCHAVPIISGVPHYPSIRRLELGGKMLINLLKETLSFQQLDMMDESWLMSHIFARTSFVAAEVGERIYGGNDKMEEELRRIEQKAPAEWSYNELLLMSRFSGAGRKARGRRFEVTWSLPDYGGSASGKGGSEARERARYGFVVQGPNPPPYRYAGGHGAEETTEGGPRKRPKVDPLLEWESSFIASTSQAPLALHSSSSNDDDGEDAEDQQTLTLSSERFSMLEHLFNPTSLGLEQKSLPELILDSISHVSSSHAAAADMMWSNIVLIGGLGNAVNLRRRLRNELRALAPVDVPLRIYPDPELKIGSDDASMLAIRAGVGLACEMSAREVLRRQREKVEHGGGAAKSVRKKVRARQSRGAGPEGEASERQGRWLTYAQWMNPSSAGAGGSSDADLVKAANLTFYPPAVSQ